MYRRYGESALELQDALDGSRSAPTTVAARPRPPRRAKLPPSRPISTSGLPTIKLHGIELNAITEARCVEHVLDELDAGNGGVLVTPNLDHLRRCARDLTFNALLDEASIVVADGMPLVWASRIQRTPLPERIAGSDLISSLSAGAARRGHTIFLLGGAPGTAEAAAKVLQERNPNLKVAGIHCPPIGFEKNQDAMNAVIAALVAAQPSIVFVALGSPKQEYLINRIRKVLPDAWWLGVGVSFSFLAGDVKRAPAWMRRTGLEWFHRLLQEPRRLFHRYIVVGLPFGLSLMSRAAWNGLPRMLPRRQSKPRPALYDPAANGNGNGNGQAIIKGRDASKPLIAPDYSTPRPIERHLAPHVATGAHSRSLHRLRALVLLGGSVRSTELSAQIRRSLLDLPVDDTGSIFNHWLTHATELARHAGLEQLPVRMMVNHTSPLPTSAAPRYDGTYRVERDLSEYRGTGGVLRDLAADYADEDLILVANAAQILMDPLAAIATALDRKHGDVSLVSHNDGTPSGVMLVSCKTLRLIPTSGYVDMKEQALPAIAARYDVSVMHRRRATGLAVRTLTDYISALRQFHRRRQGNPALSDPLAEDWRPAFALVEEGAAVDPRAHVHDSVVLKGGIVEGGAVVVRSIICPGGAVRKDRSAVDQFVSEGS
ncbi:MAG TPA: WecB/TagA/CpsF family glycosyltransferase [Tepidisphaeraceae bacterium]|nr:WecB/TagA/CpsF family glycosyltransferase [Tepidisphaeraceae bacterium]